MPSRLACAAILVYWLFAVVGLVRRDLLPELSVGTPPDLRTIASAGEDAGPARWDIQVVDHSNGPDGKRSVGHAITESKRDQNGAIAMTSKVVFDSARLLGGVLRKGHRGLSSTEEQLTFDSTFNVDPSGNLQSFHAEVQAGGSSADLWKIEGVLKNHVIEGVSKGPLPFLNKPFKFDYQPRAVVQSQFGPLDRLPGLQVGQRWDERVANPFTSQVETVRASVDRKISIFWNLDTVETLEVVHRSKTVTARTWVRRDGMVLRQEVALPLVVRLVLERLPENAASPLASPSERK